MELQEILIEKIHRQCIPKALDVVRLPAPRTRLNSTRSQDSGRNLSGCFYRFHSSGVGTFPVNL